MGNNLSWGVATIFGAISTYHLAHYNSKLSLYDLMRMMPLWCELSDEVSSNDIVLSSEATMIFSMGVTILLTMCWYSVAKDDIATMSSEVSDIAWYVKTSLAPEENPKEDTLLESAKLLMDQVDLEYKHCAASIASNNETHGKKVGGEAEWATGETSSEDEDATREITGAQIRKYSKDNDNELILRSFNQPTNSEELIVN